MKKNHLFLLNPNFDQHTLANCNLLMRITDNSFSYAIVCKDSTDIVAVFDIQECENIYQTLEDCIRTDTYLSTTYNAVKVAFHAENEMLIPAEFYEAGNPAWYKNYFQHTSYTNTYENNSIMGLHPVFTIQTNIDRLFGGPFWEEIKKYHPVMPLQALTESDGLYISFTANSAFFLYKMEGKIVYQQHFQTATADEFNYYLLWALDVLKIDGAVTPAYITGIINTGDDKYNCLLKYFTNIECISPKGFNIETSILNNLPNHYFSTLLALNVCA